MTRALFAYGTLTFAPVLRVLARRALPARPATLAGFARHALRGASYPGIVRDERAVVAGLLVGGIGPALLARLDRWEGAEYTRELVRVETESGPAFAHAYVLAAHEARRALPQDWDAAQFERAQLARWLRAATRFSAKEIDR